MRYFFALLLVLSFCLPQAKAQIDTVFWFAAPHTWVNTIQNFHIPVQFILSNPNATVVTVTVEMPATPSFVPIVTSVPAGGVSFVNMTAFNAQIIHDVPNSVLNRGLKISATQPVQVTYEVVSGFCECNPEIFTLKGSSGLGQLFYVPFQQSWPNDNSYAPQPVASFDIVATEDSTLVQILPTAALVGRPAGVQFQILLNRGQSYSATALSHLAGQRPSGSRVSSNKPVAITIKDDLVRPPGGFCADLTGDQLVPVSTYSKEYVVIRGALTISDVIVIIPTVSGVPVLVNGLSLGISTAGVPLYTTSSGPVSYISSSEPFLVSHFSGYGCELGNAVVPGLNCITGTEFQVPRRNTRAFRLQIVVPAGGQSGFRFNGTVGLFSTISWLPVPSTANSFFYADISVTTAQLAALQVGKVSNVSHPFILGVLHGFQTEGARYAYFSNFTNAQPLEIINSSLNGRLCFGDTVLLTTRNGNSISWTRPNGSQQFSTNLQISSFNSADTGWYVARDTSSCGIQADSVYLRMVPRGVVNVTLLGNDSICEGDTVQLLLNKQGALLSVELIANNGIPIPISTNHVDLFAAGSYYIRWTDSCGFSDSSVIYTITVITPQLPLIQLIGSSICADDSIRLSILNFANTGFYILFKPDGTQFTFTDSVIYLLASGNYRIRHVVGLCSSNYVDFSISGGVATYQNLLVLPDSTVCRGEAVTLYIPQVAQGFKWFLNGVVIPGAVDSALSTNNRGFFEVEVTIQNPCVDTTIRLSMWIRDHVVDAIFSANPKKGARPLLVEFRNTSIGATDYKWFKNDTLISSQIDFNYLFEESGSYAIKLIATDSLTGCADSAILNIEVLDTLIIYIPNVFTPNADGVNDRFVVKGEGLTDGLLLIYNRWGQLVFETTNWRGGWDGLINGQSAEQGTYVYVFYFDMPYVGRTLRSGPLKLIK